jgi:hypothetical protein
VKDGKRKRVKKGEKTRMQSFQDFLTALGEEVHDAEEGILTSYQPFIYNPRSRLPLA